MAQPSTIPKAVYSGSDITVVAYRGNKSPAETFALDKLKEERTKILKEEEDKAFELAEIAAKAERDLDNANQALSQARKEQEQLKKSGYPRDVKKARLREFESQDGKLQNAISGRLAATALRNIAKDDFDNFSGFPERIQNIDDQITAQENAALFKLGTIHTISYSSFREKFAVRSLGRTQAITYTRGPRTIAGTMVFNISQEHELLRLLSSPQIGFQEGAPSLSTSSGRARPIDNTASIHPDAVMIDQIEPFNLMFLFANEFGQYSALHLLNVDIQAEGQEMSIDQVITNNTMNFYATDMLPMTDLGSVWKSYDEMINEEVINGELKARRTRASQGTSSGIISANKENRVDRKKLNEGMSELLRQSRGLF